MPNLRHLVWGADEYKVDPAEFDYARDDDILAIERKAVNDGLCTLPLQHIVVLAPTHSKKFSKEHLKQLAVSRGFLPLVCEWLKPEQVEDLELRDRIALVQHLLAQIWEKIA